MNLLSQLERQTMSDYVILLSVPGLRRQDLALMPRLSALVAGGDCGELVPSFPGVTCSVQANMTTGLPPAEHGVVANGFFFRDENRVEMWTSPNSCIQRPQLWDIMHEHDPRLTAAAWFPLHSIGAGANVICWPAPKHNPNGSESLWCYSKPESLYPELLEKFGHFPLQHFWGPFANIKSTEWIVTSAIFAAEQSRPNLFYIYLSHLDYAAQKDGPDSPAALRAVAELDEQIGRLVDGFGNAYEDGSPLWLVASEYVITPVDHVSYPNRILREAELLAVKIENGREHLDLVASQAWALVDHQFSHVFVRNSDPNVTARVCELFRDQPGIAEVVTHADLANYELNHALAGDVVLISTPNSWQAYYWWSDDSLAPEFARTVDIHRKPGYDPVEMFWDPVNKGIPLDATLVRGSHGAPARDPSQRGVLLSSQRGVFVEHPLADTDVADIVLRQFGI
jgi:predicted AlkP superfamily pyrophosphatase or phosphodiesterase